MSSLPWGVPTYGASKVVMSYLALHVNGSVRVGTHTKDAWELEGNALEVDSGGVSGVLCLPDTPVLQHVIRRSSMDRCRPLGASASQECPSGSSG